LGSLPVKIAFPPGERSGGTLHVRVATGGIALEFRHREPLILSRINSHFGYGAVAALKISQGPVPKRQPPKRPPPAPTLSADEEQTLQDQLARVDDPDLRAVLARLGRNLARRS
jgi:hypothetical protein